MDLMSPSGLEALSEESQTLDIATSQSQSELRMTETPVTNPPETPETSCEMIYES